MRRSVSVSLERWVILPGYEGHRAVVNGPAYPARDIQTATAPQNAVAR